MRSGSLFFVGVFVAVCASFVCLGFGQAPFTPPHVPGGFGQNRPIPPGMREAGNQINNQQTDPPMKPRRVPPDPAKLRTEAAELRDLAAAMPNAVDQVSKGMMPKDLDENLKKIEKLARQLHSQVNQ
jgi:hypothetical protein